MGILCFLTLPGRGSGVRDAMADVMPALGPFPRRTQAQEWGPGFLLAPFHNVETITSVLLYPVYSCRSLTPSDYINLYMLTQKTHFRYFTSFWLF